LDILEKPLDLVTKFISSLVSFGSSGSNAGGDRGHYKPAPSTHSPITSNPLVPAFLLLTVGLLLTTVTPLGSWVAAAEDSPTLNQIFFFPGKKKAHGLSKTGEAIKVWTKKQSGFYYCQGGTLFGNKPGKMMTQSAALTSGFRPAGGGYCANGQTSVATSEGSNVGKQPSASGVSLRNTMDNAAQHSGEQSRPAMAIASGSVWAMKVFGTYYCQGDPLFGSRPGKLMTQSDALESGYQPAVARCGNDNPNDDSASNRPLGFYSQGNSVPARQSLAPISQKDGESNDADQRVGVWVMKELGFYYCRGDVLFGHESGVLMLQSDALAAGYQPSDARCSK
jgi:hypothetical protein